MPGEGAAGWRARPTKPGTQCLPGPARRPRASSPRPALPASARRAGQTLVLLPSPGSRFCVHSSDASARVWATTARGEADSALLSRGAWYVPLALSTREGVGWAGLSGFLLRGGAVLLGPHLRGPCLACLCMTALSFSRSFSGVAVPAPSLGVLRRRTWGLGSRDTVCQ